MGKIKCSSATHWWIKFFRFSGWTLVSLTIFQATVAMKSAWYLAEPDLIIWVWSGASLPWLGLFCLLSSYSHAEQKHYTSALRLAAAPTVLFSTLTLLVVGSGYATWQQWQQFLMVLPRNILELLLY